MEVENNQSIQDIILNMLNFREIKNKLNNKNIKKLYIQIFNNNFNLLVATDMVKEYTYGELIENRYKVKEWKKPKRKSESVRLYGEIPTLTYLIEKDKFLNISMRRYKQYLIQLKQQCFSYANNRMIVDTQPIKYSIGDIISFKVKK